MRGTGSGHRSSRVGGDIEDNLAVAISSETSLECSSRVPQREDLVDRDAQFTGGREPAQLHQLLAIRLDDEVDSLDAAACRIGRRFGGDRDKLPPGRTTLGERSSRSPPAVSNTRSTGSTMSSKRESG
jgi:hypothetical protein